MPRVRLLRQAWMDLASAIAFAAVWLLRDHFDYDTLRALLLWPVVFELYVALALFLAGLFASVRVAWVRYAILATAATGCLFAAWLTGATADMPQAWTIAAWLLAARIRPARGQRFGDTPHLQWLAVGAGHSGLLWGAGFVATVLLMLGFSSEPVRNAAGELHSTSAAWIFPLVWTPYFIAEGLLRAARSAAHPLQKSVDR